MLEIPLLPANRALVARPTLRVLPLDPLHDTVQVEGMFAHTPRRWAVVSGSLAIRAVHLVRVPANAACLLALYVPVPVCYCMPALHLHLHGTELTCSRAKHFLSSPGRRLSGFIFRHGFSTFSSNKPALNAQMFVVSEIPRLLRAYPIRLHDIYESSYNRTTVPVHVHIAAWVPELVQ